METYGPTCDKCHQQRLKKNILFVYALLTLLVLIYQLLTLNTLFRTEKLVF